MNTEEVQKYFEYAIQQGLGVRLTMSTEKDEVILAYLDSERLSDAAEHILAYLSKGNWDSEGFHSLKEYLEWDPAEGTAKEEN